MNLEQNQIKKVKIKGFRSIREQEIEFGKVNVLIGKSNSGKSNLLMAFALLEKVLNGRLKKYSILQGPDAFLRGGQAKTQSLSLEFVFGNDCAYGFELAQAPDDSLLIQKEYISGGAVQQVISTGPSEESNLKDTPGELAAQIRGILFGQSWYPYHFSDSSMRALPTAIAHTVESRNLLSDGMNLGEFLFRMKRDHPEEYMMIVFIIQQVDRIFGDFCIEPDETGQEWLQLQWKERDSDKPLGAALLSSNMLRVACLAALLMQPDELKPPTIIIDEPELGLGFCALGLVVEMLRKASHSSQIILATQSADLLDGFEPEEVLVANMDRQFRETTFTRQKEKNLKPWLEDDCCLGDLWKRGILNL